MSGNFSRRGFIGGASAFAALCGCRSTASLFAGGPKLKFGVLSDVHCQYRALNDYLYEAFRYFSEQNVDAVIIGGDMASMGMIEELRFVAKSWERAFPGDRAADGRHVEKVFVTGNHDVCGVDDRNWKNEGWRDFYCNDEAEMERHNLCTRPGGLAASWEECFHERYEPIYCKRVKGYAFVGAHWSTWSGVHELGAWFDAHGAELKGERPFFFVQHPHPKDTVYGKWAWGADDGCSTKALSKFPNAVAFSGHSHFSLTSEMSIWQGAFTSIGTATLAGTTNDYGGREASGGIGGRTHTNNRTCSTDGRQGMVVSVYDGFLSIDRRDFVYGRALGEPWVVTIPAAGENSRYDCAKRAAELGGPQFPALAGVAVAKGGDCLSCGGRRDEHLSVSFPVPRPIGNLRAYDFEVALEFKINNVIRPYCVKRVNSPSNYLPASMEATSATCLFALNELPKLKAGRWQVRDYRFRVTAYSSHGVAGAPIYSVWQVGG